MRRRKYRNLILEKMGIAGWTDAEVQGLVKWALGWRGARTAVGKVWAEGGAELWPSHKKGPSHPRGSELDACGLEHPGQEWGPRPLSILWPVTEVGCVWDVVWPHCGSLLRWRIITCLGTQPQAPSCPHSRLEMRWVLSPGGGGKDLGAHVGAQHKNTALLKSKWICRHRGGPASRALCTRTHWKGSYLPCIYQLPPCLSPRLLLRVTYNKSKILLSTLVYKVLAPEFAMFVVN